MLMKWKKNIPFDHLWFYLVRIRLGGNKRALFGTKEQRILILCVSVLGMSLRSGLLSRENESTAQRTIYVYPAIGRVIVGVLNYCRSTCIKQKERRASQSHHW